MSEIPRFNPIEQFGSVPDLEVELTDDERQDYAVSYHWRKLGFDALDKVDTAGVVSGITREVEILLSSPEAQELRLLYLDLVERTYRKFIQGYEVGQSITTLDYFDNWLKFGLFFNQNYFRSTDPKNSCVLPVHYDIGWRFQIATAIEDDPGLSSDSKSDLLGYFLATSPYYHYRDIARTPITTAAKKVQVSNQVLQIGYERLIKDGLITKLSDERRENPKWQKMYYRDGRLTKGDGTFNTMMGLDSQVFKPVLLERMTEEETATTLKDWRGQAREKFDQEFQEFFVE